MVFVLSMLFENKFWGEVMCEIILLVFTVVTVLSQCTCRNLEFVSGVSVLVVERRVSFGIAPRLTSL